MLGLDKDGVECVQQFRVKYRLVCFTMLCKIQRFILGNWGIGSYATSGLARFKMGWEIIHKSMAVYLISNITVTSPTEAWTYKNLRDYELAAAKSAGDENPGSLYKYRKGAAANISKEVSLTSSVYSNPCLQDISMSIPENLLWATRGVIQYFAKSASNSLHSLFLIQQCAKTH